MSSNGELQKLNTEVRVSGVRVALVKEHIFALSSISNRLKSAFNGHDVDWVDTDENWSSGSGSGSGSSDPITDDEDGFAEGRGYETTIRSTTKSVKFSTELKAYAQDSQSQLIVTTTKMSVTNDKYENNFHSSIGLNNSIKTENRTQISTYAGSAITPRKKCLSEIFATYFLPVVVIWLNSRFTENL